jgi:hypothetical protein
LVPVRVRGGDAFGFAADALHDRARALSAEAPSSGEHFLVLVKRIPDSGG